jgi:hypothetical protein
LTGRLHLPGQHRQRQGTQHLRRGHDDAGRLPFQCGQMLAERREQIVKRQAQPTVVYAVIEIIVRPQKQGDALAGQQPIRQHLRQHATGPHLLFARADDKHAALPGGARRQPDAVAPDLRREIAIGLAALRAGQQRIAAATRRCSSDQTAPSSTPCPSAAIRRTLAAAEALKIRALAQAPGGQSASCRA